MTFQQTATQRSSFHRRHSTAPQYPPDPQDLMGLQLMQLFGILDPLQETLGSFSSLSSSSKPEKKRRIQFCPHVQIQEIPNHTSYSLEERGSLWSSSSELFRNVQRNRREFAYESWNVRQVVEEDAMFYDRS
eukprot:CAMPEP_0176002520 /NCGR_PEP_ID=MMETSP0120_2-20121206/688_1 /TAXON_ID=160619 /ORGANISM="Kryptoperidinium foliaceum, Strain CCMP 1326" /LENGTH=131 /DNA_ID=CAMNT_0017335109 /DNA_START=195 /DNA_END=586 /DNA_ORIENTATION=+